MTQRVISAWPCNVASHDKAFCRSERWTWAGPMPGTLAERLASRFDALADGSGGPAGAGPPSLAVKGGCCAMAYLLRRSSAREVGPQTLVTLHRHIRATEKCGPKDGASQ